MSENSDEASQAMQGGPAPTFGKLPKKVRKRGKKKAAPSGSQPPAAKQQMRIMDKVPTNLRTIH